jgi:hypothetical protein
MTKLVNLMQDLVTRTWSHANDMRIPQRTHLGEGQNLPARLRRKRWYCTIESIVVVLSLFRRHKALNN